MGGGSLTFAVSGATFPRLGCSRMIVPREPPSDRAAVAKRPGLQSTSSQDPFERPSALAPEHVGRVMVKTALAFEFSKTRTICDAFDEAWALLQGLGSDLTQAPKSLATKTILAKRIIEMADQGLRNIPELRDDALAFLQHSPRSGGRNGLGGAIGAQAAALAELSRAGSVGETSLPAATGAHSTAGMG